MGKARSLGIRALIELLPRDAIDPVAPVVAVFDIMGRCYKERHFRIKPGQLEFEIVQHAALYLLNCASALNRLHFWSDLEVSHGAQELVPEPDPRKRWERIKAAIIQLRHETVTAQDILEALDTMDEAFRSMDLQFGAGRMSDGFEGITELERYMCSATLAPVVGQLNRVWFRLRAKIADNPERRTGRKSHVT